jgi:tRNA G46 methylase TrmB
MLFKETVSNARIVQHDTRMLTHYLIKGDVIYFNFASQA